MLGSDTPPYAIWVPVLVAIIAPLATYVVAARKMSGKIATSEATELWAESRSIREDYAARLATAALRAAALEEQVAACLKANHAMAGKINRLEALIDDLRAELKEARGSSA